MRSHASIAWTQRNTEILFALTHKVRVFTLSQIARTWWTDTKSGTATARRALSELVIAGYLEKGRFTTHPELELKEPVLSWRAGNPTPDFGKIAYALQSRWQKPLCLTTLYAAGKIAISHFGGAGGLFKKQYQATHDLHVSSIYLRLHSLDSEGARLWISEELLEKPERHGDKLPDAVLRDSHKNIRMIIEFGGSYPSHRIKSFHNFCFENGFPYELW